MRYSLYNALTICLNCPMKPFTMDLYTLISGIPVNTDCFTQKYDCFQNHSEIVFIT